MKESDFMNFSFKPAILKNGSIIWLSLHSLRRSFRMGGQSNGSKVIFGQVFIALLLIGICWLAGQGVYQSFISNKFDTNYFAFIAGRKILIAFGALFFMSLMTSFMFLTDRGDLDLLLSAPIKPQNIIISRLLVGAFRTIAISILFGAIFLAYSCIFYSPKLLSFVPAIFGIGLIEAATTFLIARFMLLKSGIGTGRKIVQIIGFVGVFGGVFLNQKQISNKSTSIILPHNESSFDNFLVFIGRAFIGDFAIATLILIIGILIFVIIAHFFAANFAKDSAILSGQTENNVKKRVSNLPLRFSDNFIKTMFLKEMRSLFRDPTAIVQIIAPMAGIMPAIIAIFNIKENQSEILSYVAPPLVVFLSGSMTASLAWMICSVEEANELLKSAPRQFEKIYALKAVFAFIPGFIEFTLFSILIAFFSPVAAVSCFVFCALANISVIAIEFANPKPAKRPKMMQKPDRSIISILIGIIILLLWAGASAIAFHSILWSLVPIGVALLILVFVVMFNKTDQTNHAKAIWGATNIVQK
jgi:ABC-2 type transport system permease protein